MAGAVLTGACPGSTSSNVLSMFFSIVKMLHNLPGTTYPEQSLPVFFGEVGKNRMGTHKGWFFLRSRK